MASKVIVYMADWCVWCHRAMDFFKEQKVAFEARNVDEPKYAKEAVEKSGQAGIPVIDIDGIIIVGFDMKKMKEVLGLK